MFRQVDQPQRALQAGDLARIQTRPNFDPPLAARNEAYDQKTGLILKSADADGACQLLLVFHQKGKIDYIRIVLIIPEANLRLQENRLGCNYQELLLLGKLPSDAEMIGDLLSFSEEEITILLRMPLHIFPSSESHLEFREMSFIVTVPMEDNNRITPVYGFEGNSPPGVTENWDTPDPQVTLVKRGNPSPNDVLGNAQTINWPQRPVWPPANETVTHYPKGVILDGFVYEIKDDLSGRFFSMQLKNDGYFPPGSLSPVFFAGMGVRAAISLQTALEGSYRGCHEILQIETIFNEFSPQLVQGFALVSHMHTDGLLDFCTAYADGEKPPAQQKLEGMFPPNLRSETEILIRPYSHPAKILPFVWDKIHYIAAPRNKILPNQVASFENFFVLRWHKRNEGCGKSFRNNTHFEDFIRNLQDYFV